MVASGEVEPGQLTAGGDAGLGEDVAEVEGDRAWRNPAPCIDFLVRQTRSHQLGDLKLGRGELDQGGLVAPAVVALMR